jgi:hypothetical protein
VLWPVRIADSAASRAAADLDVDRGEGRMVVLAARLPGHAMSVHQCQRAAIQLRRGLLVIRGGGPPGSRQQVPEDLQVKGARRGHQPIPLGSGQQPVSARPGRQIRFEEPSQGADVAVNRVGRAGRRLVVPQQPRELGCADGAASPGEQQSQHEALLARPEGTSVSPRQALNVPKTEKRREEPSDVASAPMSTLHG